MPILPLIDLLIFFGVTTLAVGGLLKAIQMATSYAPTLFSLSPSDLLLAALTFLGLALTLAARTWVRINEPTLTASRQAAANLEALSRAQASDQVAAAEPAEGERAYAGWQRVR